MELLILQFSPVSGPDNLNTLFSNTLSLCYSHNVRDQVSHPYRTTSKIIVEEGKACSFTKCVQNNLMSYCNVEKIKKIGENYNEII
jgi:hypothetical protein